MVANTNENTATAWQRGYSSSFDCQPCPDGFVPLSPDCNLQAAYDPSASGWTLKIKGLPAASVASVQRASGVNQTRVTATALQRAAFFKRTVTAASNSQSNPPWYPYECVPCPQGYSVDFYGLTCGELAALAIDRLDLLGHQCHTASERHIER